MSFLQRSKPTVFTATLKVANKIPSNLEYSISYQCLRVGRKKFFHFTSCTYAHYLVKL